MAAGRLHFGLVLKQVKEFCLHELLFNIQSHPSSFLEPVVKLAARSKIAEDQEGKLVDRS